MTDPAFRSGDHVIWRGVVLLPDGDTTVATFQGQVIDVDDFENVVRVRFTSFDKRLVFTTDEAATELHPLTRWFGGAR